MAGLKTASGEAIDGSFELRVEVEQGPPAPPRALALRVTGDLHVGGLMLLIVDTVGVQRDWSDHALWWAQRRQWLLRPGRTLDALGVGADAALRFAPQHRPLRLRLPNRRRLRLRLSFAQPVSRAVAHACRLLGIRHPEELSLLRLPEEEEAAAARKSGGGGNGSGALPEEEFDLSGVVLPPGAEGPRPGCPPHLAAPELQGCFRMLVAPRGGLGPAAAAPPSRAPPRGPPLLQRARINARWLDSSLSLMQQDVADDAELLLRFKYYCFLDIQPQLDAVRIAQLYEQARWALLLEEIDCTEEEMMFFAALQYHIDELGGSGEPGGDAAGGDAALDDLDAALDSLELKLGGPPPPQLEDLTAIPELKEHLEIFRPRKLALRGFRPYWAVFKETTLSYYKSPQALAEPVQQLNLKGCEVIPEVNVAAHKFCIKLLVPAPEGMSEVQLRCRDAQQYSRWVAGCRLAARGRTMADSTFGAEVRGVLALLGGGAEGAGSGPGPAPGPAPRAPPDPRLLLPPRFQRKIKAKQLTPRILDAHQHVATLSATEAKLRFLQAWQALPDFGLAYFVVRFKGSRKDEVLGVATNRLVRLEPALGSVLRTWRYSSLRQWNVNWDSQQVAIEFDEHLNVAFSVVSAPCRTVHEYLGGYISLASRAPGQPFDEELFHKLTGGQEAP